MPTSEAINYTAKMDEIEKGSSTSDEDGLCHSATQGCSIFWRHIKALQIKRFHHSKRNRKGILCEVFQILRYHF